MTRSETPSLKPQILSRTDTCWPLQSSHKAQGARFLAYRIPTTSGDSLARGCSSPRSGGSAEALTEARGGDGVHVDLVVADFLVALFVGSWLGEGRALVAMAPGDLCMHCTTRDCRPFPQVDEHCRRQGELSSG